MTVVVSPATAIAMLREGSARVVAENELEGGGVRILLSAYCPTWTCVAWWRRWLLREKPRRMLYILMKPPEDYPEGYLFFRPVLVPRSN